jgi:hypothetical protein
MSVKTTPRAGPVERRGPGAQGVATSPTSFSVAAGKALAQHAEDLEWLALKVAGRELDKIDLRVTVAELLQA